MDVINLQVISNENNNTTILVGTTSDVSAILGPVPGIHCIASNHMMGLKNSQILRHWPFKNNSNLTAH